MDKNYDESELNYLVFVLGYDLLHDYLSNVENNVYECDNAYDICHSIAHKFLDSKVYKEEEGLKYSTYELLQHWLRDNVITDKKCGRCGGKLLKSFTDGYDYQCYYCDEDFYEFEKFVLDK